MNHAVLFVPMMLALLASCASPRPAPVRPTSPGPAAHDVDDPATGANAEAARLDAELWSRLRGLDYVVDNGWAGIGLRFLDEGMPPKRRCRVYTFGSGVPIAGEEVFEVVMQGYQLAVGNKVYGFDPFALVLKPIDGEPVFPDHVVLASQLRARERMRSRGGR